MVVKWPRLDTLTLRAYTNLDTWSLATIRLLEETSGCYVGGIYRVATI